MSILIRILYVEQPSWGSIKNEIMDNILIKNQTQMRRVEMAAGLEKQIMRHAWIEVSRKRPLTAEILNRYENELVWDEVSRNTVMEWTSEMALRWKDKLNWMLFSKCARGQVVTTQGIVSYP